MSHRAIGCALALEDVSIGERLVAFSLASYANRAHLAWPSARSAAARAGLGRRQYLTARDRLVDRGLITVQQSDGGVMSRLVFAEAGPSVEREVNAELFEAVLSRSRARGGARALLAALAALTGAEGLVEGVSTEELCDASGLSDRTYRRARAELLASGEVGLEQLGGGRGCQNVWRVIGASASVGDAARARAARPAPAPRQLPLVGMARDARSARPKLLVAGPHAGRSAVGIPGRNPGVNPGQNCTPSAPKTPAQTPAKTPAETPPPYVRAGSVESLNLGIRPPGPPEGGRAGRVEITEVFTSSTGRRRVRRVPADPDELLAVSDEDGAVWSVVRGRLREAVGASMFEIWLAAVVPIAVSRDDGALLLAAPGDVHAWVASRYRRLFEALFAESGRVVRMASDRELALHQACASASPTLALLDDHDRREAI